MRRASLALALALILAGCPAPRSPAPAFAPAAPASSGSPDLGPRPGPDEAPGRLTLATYNVWFGEPHRETRVRGLLSALRESKADVIALQEVTTWFVDALLGAEWASEYHWPEEGGRPLVQGGLLLLTRARLDSLEAKPLRSNLGRGALVVRFRVGQERWAVGTCHLESYPEDGPMRAAQLDALFALLGGVDHAVLMGDFNFAPGHEPETGHLDAAYQDAWVALRPTAPGLTWDVERNPFARAGSFPGEGSSRLDRILVRASGWKPVEASLLGDAPALANPQVFPSDHFGVVVTLGRSRPGGE